MAKLQYRNLEAPTLIDVGARSTPTGAANAASALADKFASFSRTASTIGGDLAERIGAQQGEKAGAAAGLAGKPEFAQGLRSLRAYGRAYNNAATRGYAVRSELDANETAARLEAAAGTDPERFRATMEAVQKAALADAPPEVQTLVGEIYARRTSEGLARIGAAQVVEIRNEDRTLIAEDLAQKVERISELRAADDDVSFAQAQEEEAKLNLLIDSAVADGSISEVEGAAQRRIAKRDIIFNTVLARFKNELADPNGDPVSMIEAVKEIVRQDQSLTPEEETKLENALFAELRDRNSLDAMRSTDEDNARTLRHQAGDRAATTELLAGNLTQSKLLAMIEDDQLSPATTRTLLNELQSGDRVAKSDPRELARVELNLMTETEEDILENQSLTWADRSTLIQKRRDEAEGWKGTQTAKEAFDRIDRALGIAPGINSKMLSEEEARQRDEALTELYDVVNALPEDQRQGQIMAKAQEVIANRIRATARNEAERLRGALERYRTAMGDPARLSGAKLDDYNAQIARYNAQISAADNKAR